MLVGVTVSVMLVIPSTSTESIAHWGEPPSEAATVRPLQLWITCHTAIWDAAASPRIGPTLTCSRFWPLHPRPSTL